MKRCSMSQVPKNCKLKQATTTHLTGWLKSTPRTAPKADKDTGQQERSFTAVGMQNGPPTLEDNLVAP